jgi:uncharacterized protein (DUF983 family)
MTILATPALSPVQAPRDTLLSMWRGFCLKCPNCGKGHVFRAFLKVADHCDVCGEDLHHHRADDAPAYFTMVIVGHVVIGGILAWEKATAPSMWLQLAVWAPVTILLSLALLPPVKGALVGLQWAFRMHGFGGGRDAAAPDPLPVSDAAGTPGSEGR